LNVVERAAFHSIDQASCHRHPRKIPTLTCTYRYRQLNASLHQRPMPPFHSKCLPYGLRRSAWAFRLKYCPHAHKRQSYTARSTHSDGSLTVHGALLWDCILLESCTSLKNQAPSRAAFPEYRISIRPQTALP